MKLIRFYLALPILLVMLFEACDSGPKTCIIRGTVHGVEFDSLVISRLGEDFRYQGIEVPIVDSSFEYKFEFTHPEALKIFYLEQIRHGSGTAIVVFSEPGEITVWMYPEEEYEMWEVQGGKINEEYTEFQENLRTLFWSLSENSASIENEMNAWQQEYIMEHPTIVSYYLLDMQLRYFEDQVDVNKAQASYEILAKKFPGHPYNENIREMIDAMSNIKVGGKYVDFTAPDLQGNRIQLSEVIEGRIALIDLWASWCGPCISHSRSMIPIYEEFKDSGFTVVGVASEFDNSEKMVLTIEREGFPWMNLVELDKQNRIWEKYGIPNSGGSSFLVDRDGTILAIHPTVEETREILQKKLN